MSRRIDAHTHVFARASAEFPREVSSQFPADSEAPVEGLLAAMQGGSVDQAVLVQLGGASVEHHRYLARSIAEHAGRFLGIGLIPEKCPDVDGHMRDLCESGGLVGFRLRALGGPRDPFAQVGPQTVASWPIWECAERHDYLLWLYVGAAEAHLLPYMVEAFPGVRVVMNHLAICPGEGRFTTDENGRPHISTPSYNPAMHTSWRLAVYENVSVLLSGQYAFSQEAYPYADIAGWQRGLLGSFGSSRLMWGSDHPWIAADPGYDLTSQVLTKALPDISDADLARLMGGSAAEILRFPATPS